MEWKERETANLVSMMVAASYDIGYVLFVEK